jgi:hypothetical protein
VAKVEAEAEGLVEAGRHRAGKAAPLVVAETMAAMKVMVVATVATRGEVKQAEAARAAAKAAEVTVA